jgi:Arc/MetJ-type ribon-helix-helix transcriptional regulator
MPNDTDTTVKVTYSLPTGLVDEVRSVVREGAAPSYSAFVENALRAAVRREREKQLAQEFREAAEDPLFMKDLEETQKDFEHVDAETAKLIP